MADVGVDVWDRALMRARPGVWLRSLIGGLLNRPVLGFWTEYMGEGQGGATLTRQHPVWPNRVQQMFEEPKWRETARG